MFSLATKLYVAIAGFAAVCALGYYEAVGERAGWVLLLIVAGAALVAAFAGVTGQVDDRPVADNGDDVAARTVSPDAASSASVWPLVTSVALALVAVGMAAGALVLTLAIILLAVPLLGWMAQVWREHPSFTPRVAQRVDDRLVAPVLLPLGTFLAVLGIAVGISRVYLTVSKDSAAMISIAVAIGILGSLYLIAARPRMSSSAVVGLAAVAAVVLVAGGVAGAAKGERPFHPETEEVQVVHFTAKNVQFVSPTDSVEVDAGQPAVFEFENQDDAVFHNVAVYEADQGPDGAAVQGAPVFNGRPITGGNHVKYDFEAPSKTGTYIYICDFHSNMKGDLVVR